MAAATVTVSVVDTWFDGKYLHVIATLAIQANPATYVTGGLTVNLNDPKIKAQRAPKYVDVTSQSGNLYAFIAGSNNTNGLLKLFSAVNTEVGNGVAIPAANSGDTITCEFYFLGQN